MDIKELIAYSSVAHAAVYLLGVFSNSIQGIEGGIVLGLAHGFVSSGLFICVGGVLYDRTHSRLITYYRGVASIMPLFSLLFFILCLGNSGTPLTLNFIGDLTEPSKECLYSVLLLVHLSFSPRRILYLCTIELSLEGGSISQHFAVNIPDLNKREFVMLVTLVSLTVFFEQEIFPWDYTRWSALLGFYFNL